MGVAHDAHPVPAVGQVGGDREGARGSSVGVGGEGGEFGEVVTGRAGPRAVGVRRYDAEADVSSGVKPVMVVSIVWVPSAVVVSV